MVKDVSKGIEVKRKFYQTPNLSQFGTIWEMTQGDSGEYEDFGGSREFAK